MCLRYRGMGAHSTEHPHSTQEIPQSTQDTHYAGSDLRKGWT